MTLSLLVTPASLGERGAIVALADGPQARNFVLRQEGAKVVLVLRTSDSGKAGLAVPIATLTSPAPRHLLLSFSPGRLSAFVDGAATAETTPPIALPGDFFHWRPRSFTFGAEARSPERWHGTLAEIRIWNRPLAGPEIAAEAARIQALLAARPAVLRAHVEVRRLASSPAPSLEEISPYREALVVDELEVVRQLSGPPVAAERIRVARWAILDNQMLTPPPTGEVYALVLEPFAEQPQLEQFFLGDELPPAKGVPLFFDLGATAKGATGAAARDHRALIDGLQLPALPLLVSPGGAGVLLPRAAPPEAPGADDLLVRVLRLGQSFLLDPPPGLDVDRLDRRPGDGRHDTVEPDADRASPGGRPTQSPRASRAAALRHFESLPARFLQVLQLRRRQLERSRRERSVSTRRASISRCG